jgi:hypothetical protein
MDELPNPFEGIVFKKEPLGELSEDAKKRYEEFMSRWAEVTHVVNQYDVFI